MERLWPWMTQASQILICFHSLDLTRLPLSDRRELMKSDLQFYCKRPIPTVCTPSV